MDNMRKCKRCAKEFSTKDRRRKYCESKCRIEAVKEYITQYYKGKEKPKAESKKFFPGNEPPPKINSISSQELKRPELNHTCNGTIPAIAESIINRQCPSSLYDKIMKHQLVRANLNVDYFINKQEELVVLPAVAKGDLDCVRKAIDNQAEYAQIKQNNQTVVNVFDAAVHLSDDNADVLTRMARKRGVG